jgi:hypothetical protein
MRKPLRDKFIENLPMTVDTDSCTNAHRICEVYAESTFLMQIATILNRAPLALPPVKSISRYSVTGSRTKSRS